MAVWYEHSRVHPGSVNVKSLVRLEDVNAIFWTWRRKRELYPSLVHVNSVRFAADMNAIVPNRGNEPLVIT